MRNIFFKQTISGKSINSDILHLTAVSENQQKRSFGVFILPTQEIPHESSKVHGIFFDDVEKRGEIHYQWDHGEHDKILKMKKPRKAYQKFLDWIEYIREDEQNVIRLVTHNAHSFHVQVLVSRNIQQCKFHFLVKVRDAPVQAGRLKISQTALIATRQVYNLFQEPLEHPLWA